MEGNREAVFQELKMNGTRKQNKLNTDGGHALISRAPNRYQIPMLGSEITQTLPPLSQLLMASCQSSDCSEKSHVDTNDHTYASENDKLARQNDPFFDSDYVSGYDMEQREKTPKKKLFVHPTDSTKNKGPATLRYNKISRMCSDGHDNCQTVRDLDDSDNAMTSASKLCQLEIIQKNTNTNIWTPVSKRKRENTVDLLTTKSNAAMLVSKDHKCNDLTEQSSHTFQILPHFERSQALTNEDLLGSKGDELSLHKTQVHGSLVVSNRIAQIPRTKTPDKLLDNPGSTTNNQTTNILSYNKFSRVFSDDLDNLNDTNMPGSLSCLTASIPIDDVQSIAPNSQSIRDNALDLSISKNNKSLSLMEDNSPYDPKIMTIVERAKPVNKLSSAHDKTSSSRKFQIKHRRCPAIAKTELKNIDKETRISKKRKIAWFDAFNNDDSDPNRQNQRKKCRFEISEDAINYPVTITNRRDSIACNFYNRQNFPYSLDTVLTNSSSDKSMTSMDNNIENRHGFFLDNSMKNTRNRAVGSIYHNNNAVEPFNAAIQTDSMENMMKTLIKMNFGYPRPNLTTINESDSPQDISTTGGPHYALPNVKNFVPQDAPASFCIEPKSAVNSFTACNSLSMNSQSFAMSFTQIDYVSELTFDSQFSPNVRNSKTLFEWKLENVPSSSGIVSLSNSSGDCPMQSFPSNQSQDQMIHMKCNENWDANVCRTNTPVTHAIQNNWPIPRYTSSDQTDTPPYHIVTPIPSPDTEFSVNNDKKLFTNSEFDTIKNFHEHEPAIEIQLPNPEPEKFNKTLEYEAPRSIYDFCPTTLLSNFCCEYDFSYLNPAFKPQ